jgi:hypothetical protein
MVEYAGLDFFAIEGKVFEGHRDIQICGKG